MEQRSIFMPKNRIAFLYLQVLFIFYILKSTYIHIIEKHEFLQRGICYE